jgi:hypothetical protein
MHFYQDVFQTSNQILRTCHVSDSMMHNVVLRMREIDEMSMRQFLLYEVKNNIILSFLNSVQLFFH